MKENTPVLLGLGAGLAAGIAISASHNPSLLSAADAVDAIPDLFATVTNATWRSCSDGICSAIFVPARPVALDYFL